MKITTTIRSPLRIFLVCGFLVSLVAALCIAWIRNFPEETSHPHSRLFLATRHADWVLKTTTKYLFAINSPYPVLYLFQPNDCPSHPPHMKAEDFMEAYKAAEQEKNLMAAANKALSNMYVFVDLCGGTIVTSKGATLGDINLQNAYLLDANLEEASFFHDVLTGASFDGANLTGAKLTQIDGHPTLRFKQTLNDSSILQGTDFVSFSYAKMKGVWMSQDRFADAQLIETDLENARIDSSDFSDASFSNAHLKNASIWDTNISGAYFDGADVTGLVYDPHDQSFPNVLSMSRAKNLDWVTYRVSPLPLLEIREKFKESGLKDAYLAISAALKRKQNRDLFGSPSFGDKVRASLEYVAFELPTDWGYKPFRALSVIFWIYIICVPLYSISLLEKYKYSGFGFWKEEQTPNGGVSGREKLCRSSLMKSLPWAMYIGVLSAFNIGWRGLDIRGWITKLQPEPFAVDARGWPRVLAGVQALFTVLMIILWLLTYFGAPFAN